VIEEVKEVLEMEAELRPLIKRGFEIIESYGPECQELLNGVALGITNTKIRQIEHLISSGFTREEAILLTMDMWFAIARGAQMSKGGK
jgi:hypothetical protein